MLIYLASPHTFLKFKDGKNLAMEIWTGGIPRLNEDFSCREHDIPSIYRSDAIRGGFSVNEDISGGGYYNRSLETILENRGGVSEDIKNHRPFILESFYYADETTEKLIPYFGDFLLDSGAFTFIQNSKSHVNWEEYIERYADFIKRNQIQKFFELDIDAVVGYEKVVEYREKLEQLVGRQSIPVWHRNRGYNEWLKLCDEYNYMAIGGIAIKEIQKSEYPVFSKMLKDAHERKCKVHGLGFTQLKEIVKYKFDSVDSTAWTTGNRFGFLYYFDGKTMRKINKKDNEKIIDSRKAALINYCEWIKFQKYAEKNL